MLQKFGTFDELFDLYSDFDRLFRRAMWPRRDLPGDTPVMPRMLSLAPRKTAFCPAMECFTRDRKLVVRAELPGVDPKDVEVTISGNQVLLRGEKKQEQTVDEKDLFFQEVCRGRFERAFPLPEGVKADQVKASFHNGVLELTMPSGVAEQARRLPIEVIEGGKTVKAA